MLFLPFLPVTNVRPYHICLHFGTSIHPHILLRYIDMHMHTIYIHIHICIYTILRMNRYTYCDICKYIYTEIRGVPVLALAKVIHLAYQIWTEVEKSWRSIRGRWTSCGWFAPVLKNLCMENPGKNINPVGNVAKGRYMQMHQLEIGKCPMSHCFRGFGWMQYIYDAYYNIYIYIHT